MKKRRKKPSRLFPLVPYPEETEEEKNSNYEGKGEEPHVLQQGDISLEGVPGMEKYNRRKMKKLPKLKFTLEERLQVNELCLDRRRRTLKDNGDSETPRTIRLLNIIKKLF